jgi:hypothetical protein
VWPQMVYIDTLIITGPDLARKDVVNGVEFPQKTIWQKGERCLEISLIRRLCRDAFDPVAPMEAVRLATPRSVHQEAVLGSITTI